MGGGCGSGRGSRTVARTGPHSPGDGPELTGAPTLPGPSSTAAQDHTGRHSGASSRPRLGPGVSVGEGARVVVRARGTGWPRVSVCECTGCELRGCVLDVLDLPARLGWGST